MITRNRRQFLPRAIRYWQEQTYLNRELVIFDNGDSIRDVLPTPLPKDIRYFHKYHDHTPIGRLRNAANDVTNGDLIAHWDDDDYSAPTRLAHQVDALQKAPDKKLCGYRNMYFLDLVGLEEPDEPKLYFYEGDANYTIGTSFLYTRGFWRGNPFIEHFESSEDGAFRQDQEQVSLNGMKPKIRMVARMHYTNDQAGLHERMRTMMRIDRATVSAWKEELDPVKLTQVKELLT